MTEAEADYLEIPAMARPAWQALQEAVATTTPQCATDPDRWAATPPNAASLICSTCPIVNQCANYAISAAEPEGIWGGLTDRQRRRINIVNRIRQEHAHQWN